MAALYRPWIIIIVIQMTEEVLAPSTVEAVVVCFELFKLSRD